MLILLRSLFIEYLGLQRISRGERPERIAYYTATILVILFMIMALTVALVTVKAAIISEELTKYRSDNSKQSQHCEIKFHQDDSFDSGNGLNPAKFQLEYKTNPELCKDSWCLNTKH